MPPSSLGTPRSASPAANTARPPGPLLPQYAELIERIFRSTHVLVSLKRDELIRAGRRDELDELVRTTRELQDSLNQAAHKSASTDAGTSRS